MILGLWALSALGGALQAREESTRALADRKWRARRGLRALDARELALWEGYMDGRREIAALGGDDRELEVIDHPIVRFVPDPEPPKECEVWLHNDPNVEGNYVYTILQEIFGLSGPRAMAVMMAAHEQGQGLVLVTSCDRANVLADAGNAASTQGPPSPWGGAPRGSLFSVEEHAA